MVYLANFVCTDLFCHAVSVSTSVIVEARVENL